jgi:galactokinase
MTGTLEHARTFRAPGRVNLIGEHTDYNQGYVLPMAIDRYTWVTAAVRSDAEVSAWSENLTRSVVLHEREPRPAALGTPSAWANPLRGVVSLLRQRGLAARGANLLVRSELPLGGGLSSSASFESACAFALLALNQETLPPGELAQLCWRAENEWAGARCGIMDQFVVTHAAPGAAVLLDCRSLDWRPVPLPLRDVALVVANTMVKRELAASQYNIRRAECEQAARTLGAASLRDVDPKDLSRLPQPIQARARHIVEENARVLRVVEALPREDWTTIGQAMSDSHNSLRDLYEVSCPELDFMVETGRQLGSLASRMTGAGFGGCTLHFVRSSQAVDFLDQLSSRYREQFHIEPQCFLCSSGHAVGETRPV